MATKVILTSSAVRGIDEARLTPLGIADPEPIEVHLGRVRPDPILLQAYRMLTPRLVDYIDLGEAIRRLPTSTNWRAKAGPSLQRMYANDRMGDCVIARAYHNHGVWTANDTPNVAVGSDEEVISTYRSWCGHLGNDSGCLITQVLQKQRDVGVPMNGVRRKIDGFADVDNRNKELVKAAIHLFGGGMSFGVNLPQAWTSAAVWDVTNSPIVGGHDIAPVDYDEQGVYISSWGRVYLMTWAAVMSTRWVEESWVCLSPDWYNSDQLAPNGVNVSGLRDAMTKIGGGIVPDIGPTPEPPPQPPPPTPVPDTLVFPKNFGISYGITTPWVKDATGRYVASGTFSMSITKTAGEPLPDLEPFMQNIFVPAQPVEAWGLRLPGIKVPGFTINTEIAQDAYGAIDWQSILRQLCTFAPNLPEPVNHIAQALCWFIGTYVAPRNLSASDVIKLLCRYQSFFPEPIKSILAFVCRFYAAPPKQWWEAFAAKPCC